jgi:hypothetical protein
LDSKIEILPCGHACLLVVLKAPSKQRQKIQKKEKPDLTTINPLGFKT